MYNYYLLITKDCSAYSCSNEVYTCYYCKFLIQLLNFLVQFGTHDVVVLKPNKADLGSPTLGQGVVYRLKVILILNRMLSAMSLYLLQIIYMLVPIVVNLVSTLNRTPQLLLLLMTSQMKG